MKIIYDYFKDFYKLETDFIKIEREIIKLDCSIVLRIYIKDNFSNTYKYVGVTYIKPEILNCTLETFTSLYDYDKKSFFIQIHENPTLFPYIRVIQTLLTNYLRKKIYNHNKQNCKSLQLKKRI